MSFAQFFIHGSFVALFGVLIYLYVQNWMCHPATERGLHWRGTVLKFACWPVFFLGFILAVVDADIPYIPTAKKAVRGYFTPFARPLVLHSVLFIIAAVAVFLYRRFYIPEADLVLSAEKTWGMIGFAFIAFLLSLGGLLAALEANYMKEEDAWDKVNIYSTQISLHENKNP
jgi:cellulose synthase (UDP-forming)